jgi:molecular chaperone GrpE
LLVKFLDILDHLEVAQKHLNDKGLDLVIKLFKDYLKEEGVEEMERLDKTFDPEFDECLDMRQGEKNNIVVEVAKKGYLYKSKVLRVAKVIVEVNKK